MVKCFICGVGEGVVKLEFSDSFVTYGDVFNGRMVCRTCHDLVRDQKFRRSHWVLGVDGVRVLDKAELMDAITGAPEGSLVYVKSRGQKLTFLRALRHRSTKNYVAVCGEDEGVVIVRRERVRTFVERAREAHSLGIRKTEMLEGCSTRSWTYKEVCDFIEGVRGDPLWRIVVRAL
ncbi:MAG: hypothetical protein QXO22_04160 [Thermosphaera sp.]